MELMIPVKVEYTNIVVGICREHPTCEGCPFLEKHKGCYFRGKTPREWKFPEKFEDVKAINIEDTNEYQIGYKTGYDIAQCNAQATKEEWGKAEYDRGFEDGKNEVFHNTELIPELKKVEYTKGYNSAINDYNGMIQWLHDCTGDFRKFMNKKYGYDVRYLTTPHVDEGVILYDLICDHDIAEVISEFQKWRDRVEEFKVGDEVIITGLKDEETKGVIYQLGEDRTICLVGNSGLANIGKKDMTKTGRHFDQVEQILSELKD